MITSVQRPVLEYEDAGGGLAVLEQPVTLKSGPVLNGAGSLTPDKLAKSGLFAYRRAASGAGVQIWDDDAKQWKADPGVAVGDLKPLDLAYAEGELPWSGIIVAAGGKDIAGKAQYAKAVGGYPVYHFKTWFVPKDGGEGVLSQETETVRFLSSTDKSLLLVGPGEDEEPDSATVARFGLKNPAKQVIGLLTIERGSSGKITLSNSAGARLVINENGSIDIMPASGQSVVIHSDVEVERLTYRPAGGGLKKVLP